MRRVLRSNSRIKHGIHHPLLAVDCENNPKTGAFICAGVFGDIGESHTERVKGKVTRVKTVKRISNYYTSQDTFNSFLMSLAPNSCILVFYNLSYDKVYLNKIVNHASLLVSGQRVITLKLYNGIKAIDLFNHTMVGSLEDWIGYLDMTSKYGVVKAELDSYFDRVMNDAKATYYLGSFLEDFYYYECGIPLCVTIGAAAMRLFTQYYFTDYFTRENDFFSDYERKAYYGGRVELFKRGKRHVYNYDVNSMYLSVMRSALIPDVSTARYIRDGSLWRHFFNGYLGIYHMKVRAPEYLNIGVLPYRVDGKLKFPKGFFTGYWTNLELLLAFDAGYEVLECIDFVYYKQAKTYFSEYAAFVWAKRQEYKAKGNLGMDLMVKRLGNALYGKFGQRNGQDYFGKLEDYPTEIPNGCQFYDVNGETWILVQGERTPARFEFPGISAFITSYARCKLYDAMRANEDSLVYCDTDCVKTTSPVKGIIIGNELGEWGAEGEADTEFYRPKFYGDIHKGVPKRAVIKERTEDHITYRYEKPLREREAVKRGLVANVWGEVFKTLTFADDKRYWVDNDTSLPLVMIDEEARYQEWLAKRYEVKYRYGGFSDPEADYSPADRLARKYEYQEARRVGEMIYQRGKG